MKQLPTDEPKPYKTKSAQLYDLIYYETLSDSTTKITAGQAVKLKGGKR